jgi:hypothetical protein
MKSRFDWKLTTALVGGLAAMLVLMHGVARGQGGLTGEGGLAAGPYGPRIFVSLSTNAAVTTSPGLAPPGSIWFQEYAVVSGTNFTYATAWTNNAGTNFNTATNIGFIVTNVAVTAVVMRVQVGYLGSVYGQSTNGTSVWEGVTTSMGTGAVVNALVPTVTP